MRAKVEIDFPDFNDLAKSLDNTTIKYSISNIMRDTLRPHAKHIKKRIPRKTGTARKGVKVKPFSRNVPVPGAWIGIAGGRVDHFYVFHNVNPKSSRSGRGRIKTPWEDPVISYMNENINSITPPTNDKIFKIMERHVKRHIKYKKRILERQGAGFAGKLL